MFASMTLMRPHRLRKKIEPAPGDAKDAPTKYEAQVGLKDRMRAMLENEQLIPRVRPLVRWERASTDECQLQELIFLTRSMRMMQANNQVRPAPLWCGVLCTVTDERRCAVPWIPVKPYQCPRTLGCLRY
jgi:aarF domain-containing kinase